MCQVMFVSVPLVSVPRPGRRGDVLLQLDAEAGLVYAVPGLLLGFVFNFLCFLFSSYLVAILQADVSEVSCDATAALIIFGWAVTVVDVFLLATVKAAV